MFHTSLFMLLGIQIPDVFRCSRLKSLESSNASANNQCMNIVCPLVGVNSLKCSRMGHFDAEAFTASKHSTKVYLEVHDVSDDVILV